MDHCHRTDLPPRPAHAPTHRGARWRQPVRQRHNGARGHSLESIPESAALPASAASSLLLKHELAAARELQRNLLPDVPDLYNGVRMHAVYRPVGEVGGDFYDLMEVSNRRFLVVIGDVSGHGIAAALMMSRISSEFRWVARQGFPPDEVLRLINGTVADSELFVTAMCIEVDPQARSLRVANAGHNPIFGRRRATGDTWLFGEASGAPLGMLDDESYTVETAYLERGDLIVLTTDGVTEALEPNAAPSGGVVANLIAGSPHDVVVVSQRIADAVVSSERGAFDDVAVLAMEMS